MRKGAKRRDWTVAELQFLRNNAGLMPRRELSRALKRGAESVKQQAKRMRAEGEDVTLRCFRSRLATCPSCGAMRSRMGSEGICEPCRRRRQLAKVQGRIADLMARLPQDERAVYEATEAETESSWDPMPRPPDTSGMGRYERARAEEAREIAVEDWLSRNLRRQVKASQKRKERIEKKVKSMTLSEYHQIGAEK